MCLQMKSCHALAVCSVHTLLISLLTCSLSLTHTYFPSKTQLPDASDAEGRRALKRLQDVGVHVLTPAAELAAKPLAGAVAVMSLAEALAAGEKRVRVCVRARETRVTGGKLVIKSEVGEYMCVVHGN